MAGRITSIKVPVELPAHMVRFAEPMNLTCTQCRTIISLLPERSDILAFKIMSHACPGFQKYEGQLDTRP